MAQLGRGGRGRVFGLLGVRAERELVLRTAPSPQIPLKQVFVVPASGPEALQHYLETIERKRTLREIENLIPPDDLKILRGMYRETPFAVWGATSGRGNTRTFSQMNLGDYILFLQRGKVVLIGEIAWKTQNREIAQYFWNTNVAGETWENIYFIINERKLNIPAEQLWKYLDYEPTFRLQGLMQVDRGRVAEVEKQYGGFSDVLLRLARGEKPQERPEHPVVDTTPPHVSEEDEKPREHNEIQWRLIRLGHAAGVDVWIPKNDQGKEWEGHKFKEQVLHDFKSGLDIPRTVENIDTVWRFGYQIKAAFEIEHSTSVYSGLLRLADLRTIAPNSLYPLYIAAPKERREKVISELKRPTFHDKLMLHEVARYISYDKIRELDEKYGSRGIGFGPELLERASERVA